MTTQHTPGPWHANAIAKGKIIGDADTPGAEKIQINNHHATVATVYRPKDARLIAAAPDLLAALQQVLDCPCMNEDGNDETDAAAYAAARAAIAKATGA